MPGAAAVVVPDGLSHVAAHASSDVVYFATAGGASRELWAYVASEDRVAAVWASMGRCVLSVAHAGALVALEADERGAVHLAWYAVDERGRVEARSQIVAGPSKRRRGGAAVGLVRCGGGRAFVALGDEGVVYDAPGADALFDPRRRFRRGVDAGRGDAVVDGDVSDDGGALVFATRRGVWTCTAAGASDTACRVAVVADDDDARAARFLGRDRLLVSCRREVRVLSVAADGAPVVLFRWTLLADLARDHWAIAARGDSVYALTARGLEAWRHGKAPGLELVHAAPFPDLRMRLALIASSEGEKDGRAWPLEPEPAPRSPASPGAAVDDVDAFSVDSFEETGLYAEVLG